MSILSRKAAREAMRNLTRVERGVGRYGPPAIVLLTFTIGGLLLLAASQAGDPYNMQWLIFGAGLHFGLGIAVVLFGLSILIIRGGRR